MKGASRPTSRLPQQFVQIGLATLHDAPKRHDDAFRAESAALLRVLTRAEREHDALARAEHTVPDADLAIFRSHPFAPDTRVEMTLVDGKVMFDRSKDVAARKGVAATLGGGQ